MPLPSQVNRVGIAAPSAKAGLESVNAPNDGDGAADAVLGAVDVAAGVGDAVAAEAADVWVLAGLVSADEHAASRTAAPAAQSSIDRRMAGLSTVSLRDGIAGARTH